MTTQIEKAKAFAQQIHEGHFRRDGVTPYFAHLEAVAKNCKMLIFNWNHQFSTGEIDIIIAVAYLHDSIEDGKTDEDSIRSIFGDKVSTMVRRLTHDKDDNYLDYIRCASLNEISRLIKIADVLANLADSPTQKQLVKYTEALKILIK